jgi:hypothetical protein
VIVKLGKLRRIGRFFLLFPPVRVNESYEGSFSPFTRITSMSQNRRAFLQQLGLGTVGASLLALPNETQAFGRRRRGSCEVVPVEEKRRPTFAVGDDIEMSFPRPGAPVGAPFDIYGKGSFCAWGTWASSVADITEFKIVDYSGGTISGVTYTRVSDPTPIMPCRWAWFVKSVPVNTVFQIKITYVKVISGTPQTQAPLYFNYFRCLDYYS